MSGKVIFEDKDWIVGELSLLQIIYQQQAIGSMCGARRIFNGERDEERNVEAKYNLFYFYFIFDTLYGRFLN